MGYWVTSADVEGTWYSARKGVSMPDTVVKEPEVKEVKTEVKTPVETGIKPAVTAPVSDKDILKASVAEGVKPEVKVEPEPVKVEPAAAVEKVEPEADKVKIQKRINKLLEKNKPSSASPVVIPDATVSTDGLDIKDGKIDIKKVDEYINKKIAAAQTNVMGALSNAEKAEKAQSDRLEANKLVYEKHPEILDIDEGKSKHEDVPFAVALNEAYAELRTMIPGFDNVPAAPKIAMELAEKKFGESESVRKARLEGAAQESRRQASVQASGVVSSAGGSGAHVPAATVTLSQDEQVVAKRLGLSDSDYGKYKKRAPVLGPTYYDKYRYNKPRG